MKQIKDMTMGELAAFINTHLEQSGVAVVLSGGACVCLYSSNRYVSMDLDFVNIQFAKRRIIKEAMQEIGFNEENRYFKHPDTDMIVEFPAGPLAVGEEPVRETNVLTFETGTLRLLSPTDCVKDRLTWYYHSNDQQCLKQAVLIAQSCLIDLNEIQRWSEVEGSLEEFRRIRNELTKTKK